MHQYELRSLSLVFEDNGIVICRVKPGASLELADAEEQIRVMGSINGGIRRPVLVDMGAMHSISRDCRRYFSGPESAKVESAVALLVKSPLARAIGNFFMGVNKTPYPTRLFTSEPEAMAWLRHFVA